MVQQYYNIFEELQSQQKHAIRIIFHKKKYAHARELLKENNILNIYQLNIIIDVLFLMEIYAESKMERSPTLFSPNS